MASVCMSNCVKDVPNTRVPIRATYVNLYKWPESDAEFVRSMSIHGRTDTDIRKARVVDSISCRQMYLRSYTFSREESVPEKSNKCFGKVKGNGKRRRRRGGGGGGGGGGRGKRRCLVMRKVKEVSCCALFKFFNKLLSCSASVDVVDQHNNV